MTRFLIRAGLLSFVLVSFGCNHCGERHRLFGRFRDRDDDDDYPSRRLLDRRNDGPKRDCNDPCPPRSNTGSYGQPIFGNPVGLGSGIYPGGTPIYTGGAGIPTYPSGPSRPDELPPPGGYQPIPPAGLPSSPFATPRPTESSRLIDPTRR